MIPTEQDALIAREMVKDPEWREWAYLLCGCTIDGWDGDGRPYRQEPDPECDDCHGTGRVPRDFADPANTLRLAGWWGWRLTHAPWTDRDADVAGEIDDAMGLVASGFIVAAEGARRVRDIIAARLKELDDAD